MAPGSGAEHSDSFFGQQYSLYAEVGLSPEHPVQLSASLPVNINRVEFTRLDDFEDVTGRATSTRMGDLRIAPQIALHRTLPLSAALEVKLPLYANGGLCAGNPYFEECAPPGAGQVDLTGLVAAGASISVHGRAFRTEKSEPASAVLGARPSTESKSQPERSVGRSERIERSNRIQPLESFGELAVGYRHRTEWYVGWDTDIELVDALVWQLGAGSRLGPVLAMVKADGDVRLAADDDTPMSGRVGPAVLVDLVHGLALEGRAAWEVYASQASRGTGFGAGVSWRR